ncbi:MAG: hypothetical protein OEW06_03290 [Gemmatimonadota bacterium]|nr:hypothetical protein [Gemmatimonadota bacterium]
MRSLLAALAAILVVACGDDATGGNNNNNTQLPAPSNVQAAIVNGNIVMTWDSVPGALTYRVYMASEPGVRKSNLQQLLDNMYHPDLSDGFDHPPGLSANLQYFLVVTAVGANGESSESCEVAATIGTNTGGSC